jgi:DNA-binding NarL/FixJ family response regulator
VLPTAERRILELIGDGLSNREIGERLQITEKTVKNHVSTMLAKMGARRSARSRPAGRARSSAGRT